MDRLLYIVESLLINIIYLNLILSVILTTGFMKTLAECIRRPGLGRALGEGRDPDRVSSQKLSSVLGGRDMAGRVREGGVAD